MNMTNTPFLFLPLDAVKFFDKPYFDGKEWHNLSLEQGEQRIFLTETRSAMLGVPAGEDEEPFAYIFSVYGRGDESYIPVFDRTNKVEIDHLYSTEIVSNR
jgi:hypothetical protein